MSIHLDNTADQPRYITPFLCSNGGCVGVALHDGVVKVTNTTTPGGPVAVFTTDEWEVFRDAVKRGEFELADLIG